MTDQSIEMNIYNNKINIRDNTSDNFNEPDPVLNFNSKRPPYYPNNLDNVGRDINSAPRPNYGRPILESNRTESPIVNQNNIPVIPVPIQQFQQPINQPIPTTKHYLVPVVYNGQIQHVLVNTTQPMPNGQVIPISQPPIQTELGQNSVSKTNPHKHNCCNCCDCGGDKDSNCCCVGLFAGLCAACTCCTALLCCLVASKIKD